MRESLTEKLTNAITLTEAARLCHCHVASTWRHATRGVRGVKLATFFVAGKRMTTLEAVEEFLIALNSESTATSVADPAVGVRRSLEAAKAIEALGC